MNAPIHVTGAGVISSLGTNHHAHAAAIAAGKHGFSEITAYDTTDSPILYASVSPASEQINIAQRKLMKFVNRKDLLGLGAAHAALQDADLLNQDFDPTRAGVFVGSCSSQLSDLSPYFNSVLSCLNSDRSAFNSSHFGSECLQDVNPLAAVKVLMNACLAHISQLYNLRGANSNFMDGEVSSEKALHAALYALRSGKIDWCLVGAISAPVDPFQMTEMWREGLLATQSGAEKNHIAKLVRPYTSEACGTIAAEGAAFIVLETEAVLSKRQGRQSLARVTSCSLAAAGSDLSAPGITRAGARSAGCAMADTSNSPDLCFMNGLGIPEQDQLDLALLQALKQNGKNISHLITYTAQTGAYFEARGLFNLIHAMHALMSRDQSALIISRNRFGQTGATRIEKS